MEKKLFYDINEVAAEFRFAASKLRYWEKAFPMLKPKKNAAGDRFYTPDDVLIIKEIVDLVEVKKHKLDQARKLIEDAQSRNNQIKKAITRLEKVKTSLQNLRDLME